MDYWELEELAAALLGLSDEEADGADIDNLLYERFDISFEQFEKIVLALIPFTVPATTALGDQKCQGFVKDGAFIVKIPLQDKQG